METKPQNTPLTEALATFETCLETPVIPGELPSWCQRAKVACDDLQAHLRTEIQQEHPTAFQKIRQEDIALEPHIEEMRETDEQLLANIEQVHSYLKHLTDAGEAVEPDEERIEEYVKSAVEKGLALVIAIRKQQLAMDTWYLEALDRDRGVVG